mgnify:FL=1
MVGLFVPVIGHLSGVTVDVIEREPDAMTLPDLDDDVSVELHPPSAADAVVPEATVVFVTGSTLVYGGLRRYLDATTPAQTVVIVGASASFDPSLLFRSGVSIVAGATVAEPDAVRRGVAAGRSEADLHDEGLEKWLQVEPGTETLTGIKHR